MSDFRSKLTQNILSDENTFIFIKKIHYGVGDEDELGISELVGTNIDLISHPRWVWVG